VRTAGDREVLDVHVGLGNARLGLGLVERLTALLGTELGDERRRRRGVGDRLRGGLEDDRDGLHVDRHRTSLQDAGFKACRTYVRSLGVREGSDHRQ
jgi:hypothetical protein